MNHYRRHFNRAALSRQDFYEAREFLKELKAGLKLVQEEALLMSAIICYARPFSQNDPSGRSEATSTVQGNAAKILDKAEFELHTRILEFRNKAVAHSDYDFDPVKLIDVFPDGMITEGPYFEVRTADIPLAIFASIIEKMFAHCSLLVSQLKDKAVRTSR